jgi:adenosylhomocysteinase
MIDSHIKDVSLAAVGKKRIDWAFQTMPVLASIEKRFEKDKPLKGSVSGLRHSLRPDED